MRFQNPANGYVVSSSVPFLWCLLFGFFYFAFKGVWKHALIGFLAGFPTLGLSWFVYPFFAKAAVRDHYLQMGWRSLDDGPSIPTLGARYNDGLEITPDWRAKMERSIEQQSTRSAPHPPVSKPAIEQPQGFGRRRAV